MGLRNKSELHSQVHEFLPKQRPPFQVARDTSSGTLRGQAPMRHSVYDGINRSNGALPQKSSPSPQLMARHRCCHVSEFTVQECRFRVCPSGRQYRRHGQASLPDGMQLRGEETLCAGCGTHGWAYYANRQYSPYTSSGCYVTTRTSQDACSRRE